MTTVAVTGATGRLGGQVARLLAERGVGQRLLVRSPDRAPQLPKAEIVGCHYENSPASRAALEGVEVLLMVSAAEHADRLAQHRAFIDAAHAVGVNHVVYTSFVGAGPEAGFTLARDHGATEQHLQGTGMDLTILRNNFYADVFPSFATEGVIAGPAGQGRVAAVAIRDVARVAATVLAEPQLHRGEVYELTGPEALTLDQIAAAITTVTAHPTRFRDQTLEEAFASRAGYGVEPWQVEAWVSTYTAIRDGELRRVTTDVERVTGTPAIRLEEALAS